MNFAFYSIPRLFPKEKKLTKDECTFSSNLGANVLPVDLLVALEKQENSFCSLVKSKNFCFSKFTSISRRMKKKDRQRENEEHETRLIEIIQKKFKKFPINFRRKTALQQSTLIFNIEKRVDEQISGLFN